MISQFTPAVSVLIAFVALLVAVWNVRNSRESTRRSGAVSTVEKLFKEYRSVEFREHAGRVLSERPLQKGGGFDTLPEEYRNSAYHVCYFYDHLGLLIAFRLVRRDVILGAISSQVVMTWYALYEFIKDERARRYDEFPRYVSSGFLRYFEGLVDLIDRMGGEEIGDRIAKKIGLPGPAKIRSWPPSADDGSGSPLTEVGGLD